LKDLPSSSRAKKKAASHTTGGAKAAIRTALGKLARQHRCSKVPQRAQEGRSQVTPGPPPTAQGGRTVQEQLKWFPRATNEGAHRHRALVEGRPPRATSPPPPSLQVRPGNPHHPGTRRDTPIKETTANRRVPIRRTRAPALEWRPATNHAHAGSRTSAKVSVVLTSAITATSAPNTPAGGTGTVYRRIAKPPYQVTGPRQSSPRTRSCTRSVNTENGLRRAW
jgi:hypothetical protein